MSAHKYCSRRFETYLFTRRTRSRFERRLSTIFVSIWGYCNIIVEFDREETCARGEGIEVLTLHEGRNPALHPTVYNAQPRGKGDMGFQWR